MVWEGPSERRVVTRHVERRRHRRRQGPEGAETDEIAVRGGDVLRLEVAGLVEIGERVRSGKGFARRGRR